MTFKQEWDIKMALAVLKNKTVDGELWAEAVEWLMLYGPPQIQDLLGQASSMATSTQFPELAPAGYGADGAPFYNINELAESLGISAEETKARLQQKEQDGDIQHLFPDDEPKTIH
ncbi:MAG: hypothetical protein PF442_02175 [Desulfobulbaceae bacterium]|nr:hypothetical protein [Desulfobulbaceae bacterium]